VNDRETKLRRAAFARALTAAYVRNPCGVLPNALWKTIAEIDACEVSIDGPPDDPEALTLGDAKRLLVTWHRDGVPSPGLSEAVAAADLVLLPRRSTGGIETGGFRELTAHARLIHRMRDLPADPLEDQYRIAEAEPAAEAEAVAELIVACYDGMRMQPETVHGWTEHVVFDPTLWVWIRERETAAPAALGIAEYDRAIGEVSLEWIQVLPGHRRRGLGKALVVELLRRAARCGTFATVSGIAGSPAEALYRACGFTGDDVWWCLRR